MSAKLFKVCMLVIAAALAVFIGVSVIMEWPVYVPISGIVLVVVLVRICRRNTREVLVDERQLKIDEKASALSQRAFSIMMALASTVFISLRNVLPAEYNIIGQALAYSVCILMLLHMVFLYFYGKRL